MQSTIQLKSQFLHSRTDFFLNPFLESPIPLQNFTNSSKSPVFAAFPLFSRKTQIRKPIVCARKSKRRYGSKRSTDLALELISTLASNLKVLPPPLDLVLQHLVAAGGEGLGFLNGFKGGRFYQWQRRRVRRINGGKILGSLVILGSCMVCLLLGKDVRSDLLFGILGFICFVLALIKEWGRGFKDWVFGFVCVGILLGLGFRGNGGVRWIKEIRVPSSSSVMEILRRGKRRGRWTL
ncbi:Detected protein of unknown function [Hibiscus syriacus]|uniref:Uncharacterized protein n=1 Tax=Hibiscus syriacus TaxID=106335 RepID=A0A6A3CZY4_HIBSY|nr:uncharacterized protein LOC120115676 [Hibiscus syriacus]KAE8734017.1 Detected protein of unknown function [Hibiscus syriacus]